MLMNAFNPMLARCWGQIDRALESTEKGSLPELRRLVSQHMEGQSIETIQSNGVYVVVQRLARFGKRESFVFPFTTSSDAMHFVKCFQNLCVVGEVPVPSGDSAEDGIPGSRAV